MQIKKWFIGIILAVIAICISSCSVSKNASTRYQNLSQRAQLTLSWNQQRYGLNSTIRIWHDELILVSVQPMPGIEMMRLEADRDSVWVMDKMNKKYVALAYSEIEKQTGVKMNYRTLQEMLSKPITEEKEHVAWIINMGKRQAKLSCRFFNREYNTLSAATRTKTDKYQRVSIKEILPI